jgi:ADP-ribose pyrophosphatase YjhB (NUDIX family)
MAAVVADISASRIRALWESDPGHVTPRIGVGAVIFDESGALLLLKRPESDYWALPVGFAEVGESAAQGVAREVREETALIVSVERLLGVYDCRGPHLLHQLYNLIFECKVIGGELTRTAEAPDHGYFEPSALPPLLPHHRPSIEDAFASRDSGRGGPRVDR